MFGIKTSTRTEQRTLIRRNLNYFSTWNWHELSSLVSGTTQVREWMINCWLWTTFIIFPASLVSLIAVSCNAATTYRPGSCCMQIHDFVVCICKQWFQRGTSLAFQWKDRETRRRRTRAAADDRSQRGAARQRSSALDAPWKAVSAATQDRESTFHELTQDWLRHFRMAEAAATATTGHCRWWVKREQIIYCAQKCVIQIQHVNDIEWNMADFLCTIYFTI